MQFFNLKYHVIIFDLGRYLQQPQNLSLYDRTFRMLQSRILPSSSSIKRNVHSEGSNTLKTHLTRLNGILVPLMKRDRGGVTFSLAPYFITLHVQMKNTCNIPVCPPNQVVQCMLNDVLCNRGTYTNGYSICVCVLENGGLS